MRVDGDAVLSRREIIGDGDFYRCFPAVTGVKRKQSRPICGITRFWIFYEFEDSFAILDFKSFETNAKVLGRISRLHNKLGFLTQLYPYLRFLALYKHLTLDRAS